MAEKIGSVCCSVGGLVELGMRNFHFVFSPFSSQANADYVHLSFCRLGLRSPFPFSEEIITSRGASA